MLRPQGYHVALVSCASKLERRADGCVVGTETTPEGNCRGGGVRGRTPATCCSRASAASTSCSTVSWRKLRRPWGRAGVVARRERASSSTSVGAAAESAKCRYFHSSPAGSSIAAEAELLGDGVDGVAERLVLDAGLDVRLLAPGQQFPHDGVGLDLDAGSIADLRQPALGRTVPRREETAGRGLR